ncbi:MAG TPA: DUF3775 domain-containing protein [Rhizomicrobium sp.]|jgi:hypothetical protein|nr:DUF3775 domain-containing protein [Rhizomicrobium sp.]
MPKAAAAAPDAPAPELNIPIDKVGFIIVKAREFDGKEGVADPDSGSNPTDDGVTDVLEDQPGDSTQQELFDAIRGLNEDERIELIGLAWIGRGTFSLDEWQEALDTAYVEHGKRPARYLLSMPLLGDYLEEGLAAFGETISDANATA